jgi:hypothetical protein
MEGYFTRLMTCGMCAAIEWFPVDRLVECVEKKMCATIQ